MQLTKASLEALVSYVNYIPRLSWRGSAGEGRMMLLGDSKVDGYQ